MLARIRAWGGALAIAGALPLLLTGCTGGWFGPQPAGPEPTLVVEIVADTTVTAWITHPIMRADVYTWDWGDGTPEDETRATQVTHRYENPGLYVLSVRAYRREQGDGPTPGLPGSGQTSLVLLRELVAVVDLRPPIEIRGIHVAVLAPPYWYNPTTWPQDCYPGGCSLELSLVVMENDPRVRITHVNWYIRDGQTYELVSFGHGERFVVDGERFLPGGCHGPMRMPYVIHVVAFLNNGASKAYVHTIYACSSRGCGG